ncbi:MAG: hypothetical protein N2V72_00730 [Methanophagales archaeon]|nr:hypothetical protein [Methanophagales archaeon]
MKRIFVGKKIIANQKVVWDNQCRTAMFCYHCELPILATTEEIPEDFRCPRCGCPHFQTLEQKIQEEKDLDLFRERAKELSENEARKIAELEAIRHIPY